MYLKLASNFELVIFIHSPSGTGYRCLITSSCAFSLLKSTTLDSVIDYSWEENACVPIYSCEKVQNHYIRKNDLYFLCSDLSFPSLLFVPSCG